MAFLYTQSIEYSLLLLIKSMSILKIAIVGKSRVGKTSLFHKYTQNHFSESTDATTGMDVAKYDTQGYTLAICDTSCDKQFIGVTKSALASQRGIVLVYDITNKQSFEDISEWADEIKKIAPHLQPPDILLVGAKCDATNRQITMDQGAALAKQFGWSFLEASAKDGTNIDHTFEYFIKRDKEKLKSQNVNYDQMDELEQLRYQRAQRRMRKERELHYLSVFTKYLFYCYSVGLVVLVYRYLSLEKTFDYSGTVEDSCQDLQTLKNINDKIFPLVDELTYQKFFKIFRVNLENDCPFYVSEYICTSKKCVVCTCNTSEIPDNWMLPTSSPIAAPKDEFAFWESERYLSPSEWIWHVEDLENDKGVYVDLKLNPEAYTGYQGQHIWNYIYNENCYQGSISEMCREERALIKLLSGLHASISTQLSEFYVDLETNRTYPNYSVYFQKVGNHPERVKNLFFLYSLLLRCIILASPGIQSYNITSMSFQEDLRARQLLNEVLSIANSQCSMPFDEKSFFREITFDQKKQYQRYIHNISKIMDCVECQKCRVFGKMQTYGLGTAFKILFSDSPSEFSGKLKRNELVALLNTFGKVSSSVKSVQLMYERRAKYYENLVYTIFFCGGMLIVFLIAVRHIYKEMDKKINNMFKNIPYDDRRQPRQPGNVKQKRD